MDAVAEIAAGGQPGWSETYDHPEYGKLTFRVRKLPTAVQWLAQTVAQDNLTGSLMALPSGGTSLLSAALSSLQTIIECPVISETREDDPDNEGHFTVTTVKYNPLLETDIQFVVRVYQDFWTWRADLLNRVDDVGKSSGETSGDGSVELSLPTTVSP